MPETTAQSWNADDYGRNARFVSDLGAPVLALLAPQPGERILDLGCGDGALTAKLVESGAAVVGVDASAEMIAGARARGLDARVMDGQRLMFAGEFDAVFTNAALHWMADTDAVLTGVAKALKPGGRFVGEFGGHGNIAAIAVALLAVCARRGVEYDSREHSYYPTAAEFRAKLNRHGFSCGAVELLPRPTLLPTGMDKWLDTFRGFVFQKFPVSERAAVRAEALELLRPVLCDTQGQWTADYVRLRFRATLRG